MEKIKPKQVIDQLQITKKSYKLKISTIKEIYSNKDIPDIFKNDIRQYEQKIQALDHAITCVGAIEQIKWERDIAIQQLNELGYQFGEEITSCTRCKFGSIITDGAGIKHQDCDIGKKTLSPVCRNKCDYFELNEDKE